ncbi:MAG: cytochrome c biogenesis protein CcsA [Spirulina sp. SIO3F2]|nr:cytochrome c biogenesis protein CcsA [Spirulina sp. SIO3F2]
MKLLKFLIGLCLGALLILVPLSQFQASPLAPLQDLAVQLDGRKKPLDTVARETVQQIHGRATYHAANGEKLDALQTYLAMLFNDRDWNEEPFVLLNYRPLKTEAGLDPEQKYFAFSELMRSRLGGTVARAHQKEAADQDLSRDEREALSLENRLTLLINTVSSRSLPLVPHPDDAKGAWVGIDAAETLYEPETATPITESYQTLRQRYRNQPEAVAPAAETLREQLVALSPGVYPAQNQLERETRFYRLHPFAKAWQLYALAFIAMLAVLLFNLGDIYWGAIGLFVAGLAIHGYGFWERMQIAGRPPVTNMYESVIWVSFGVAAIALSFELIHRAKYYLLAAAPLSVVCLLLADSLPAVLDPSIRPLVPVLRDNFWLAVHVPTITLSYASFALAFGLGHILLGHTLFAPNSTRIASLSKWNYGVLQVGVLLLATGIILGGIWAHFSWGRFWGWDPKETWALIALMCYVVPLHGRLMGWLGSFGLAVTSVVSFNAVLMAWYGVNFVLGTGLHSYGFSTGGSEAIVGSLVLLDLGLVVLAALKHQGKLPRSKSTSEELETTMAASDVPVQQS